MLLVAVLGVLLTAAPPRPAVAAAPPRADAPAAPPATYDLQSLRAFTKVLLYVKDHYAQPKRIVPQELFVGAVQALPAASNQRVVVASHDGGGLAVTVRGQTRTFATADLDSLWKMSFRLNDVVAFIDGRLGDAERATGPELERAMIDGMLAALDPRARFLRPWVGRRVRSEPWCEGGRTIRQWEFPDETALELPIAETCERP